MSRKTRAAPWPELAGVLLGGLEGLLTEGASKAPAGSFLGALARALGARRAAWLDPEPVADSRAGRARLQQRGDALQLSFELGGELAPGEIRRLSRAALERCAQVARRREPPDELLLARAESGGTLWLESDAETSLDDDTLRMTARWVAHYFQVAEQLTRLDADETLRTRGVAALSMVHDLRHQLSLASLCALRLRESRDDDDAQSTHAAELELERALEKARHLAQDGLSEAHETRAHEVRLFDLLQEEARAAGTLEGARSGGQVAIALRCNKKLRVRARESLLSRLVRNLLLNATKASSAGDRILVSARESEGRVVIEIEDRGKGMSREQIRHLFTSDKTRAGGAGCGTLSILACVEELDAELEVESAPGAGTRVRLFLGAREASRESTENYEILLVDGHAPRRKRRIEEWTAQGATVFAVADVASALLEIDTARPRRILVARGYLGATLPRLAARAEELGIELVTLDYRGSVSLAESGASSEPVQPA